MKAIDFVVRTGMGAVQRGQVAANETVTRLGAGQGSEISLNVRQADLQAFTRVGNNLEIVLVDGRVVLIENYFQGGSEPPRLFISADGFLNEVNVVQGDGGRLFAQYGPTEQWGKWSPTEDLIFVNESQVVSAESYADDEVSMLGAGLLGPGLGLLGGAAAIIGGGAILGGGGNGGGGGGGGGGTDPIIPTVNEKDPIIIGGDTDPVVVITGTGAPGSEVEVSIGDETVTTVVGPDGNWGVEFEGDDFPSDGEYDVVVVVIDPSGTQHDLTGPDVVIDLTPPDLTFTDGTVSVNDITNAEDHADGVELAGTGEPGASVVITVNGQTINTTVAADGTWAAVINTTTLPGGEYTVPVTVVTTDGYGNSATYTDAIQIDTVPNAITINASTFEGDGTMNAVEHADGITVTGSSIAGQTVTVTLGGVSQAVTVAADGTWTTTFATGTLAGGEYDTVITATSTDAAGNVNTVSETVRVDTITSVSISANPIAGDDIVNAAEAAGVVTITGMAEAGATVVVTIAGTSHNATVASNGAWTLALQPGSLPAGEYDTTINVLATDAAGNTATTSRTIHVDTINGVTIDTGLAGGDNMVSAAEHAQGVQLTGTTQPGSTVSVKVGNVTLPATVDANGNWSVTLTPGNLPTGEYQTTMQVTSTDAAGNVATASGTLNVDTLSFVQISSIPVEGDNIINFVERTDGVTLNGTTQPGSSVRVSFGTGTRMATVDSSGNWTVDFPANEIPQGESTATITAVATDAAGNSSTATGSVEIDTIVRNFSLNGGIGGADGIINAAEAAEGLIVTGTTEPGATVVVKMGTATVNATVAADGSWTATIPANQIPQGEYTTTLTATTTDRAGNVEVLNSSVRVDTDAGLLTLSQAPIEGDNVVNYEESLDGVVIRGTSDPGAIVQVTLGTVTLTTQTDANGNWERLFTNAQLPSGDAMNVPIVARKTDAAGNTREVTGNLGFDRVVENLSVAADKVGGDGTINGAERAAGVTVTGTVEPGSSVLVTLGTSTRTATVDAQGNWTASFTAAAVPQGETTLPLVVNATDRHGNTDSTSSTVNLDTLVNTLTQTADPTKGDGVINKADAAQGVTLGGAVEAGSVVMVTVGGIAYEASVTPGGAWTLTLPPQAIPAGAGTLNVRVSATDAAGNTDSINQSFALDLVAPNAPDIENYTRNTAGYAAVSVALTDDNLQIFEVHAGVPGNQVGGAGIEIPALGLETFSFNPVIVDGSHLIVQSTDTAGNTSSTYLVLDEKTTSTVDMSSPQLGAFNIEHIDLQFAEDSQLTLTEASIVALSSNTDTVVVIGGVDDTLTIAGAVKTTETRVIEGQTYSVYTLGDSATVVVDEDIQIVI